MFEEYVISRNPCSTVYIYIKGSHLNRKRLNKKTTAKPKKIQKILVCLSFIYYQIDAK